MFIRFEPDDAIDSSAESDAYKERVEALGCYEEIMHSRIIILHSLSQRIGQIHRCAIVLFGNYPRKMRAAQIAVPRPSRYPNVEGYGNGDESRNRSGRGLSASSTPMRSVARRLAPPSPPSRPGRTIRTPPSPMLLAGLSPKRPGSGTMPVRR